MIPSPEDLDRGNAAASVLLGLASDLDSRILIVPRDKDGVALGLVLATADVELVEAIRTFLDDLDASEATEPANTTVGDARRGDDGEHLCTTCGEPCQCGWWPDGCDHACADDAEWVTR